MLGDDQKAAWNTAVQGANGIVSGGGTPAYTGDLQGAQSAQSQQALSGIMNTAGTANASALGTSGVGLANGLLNNNGMSADMQKYLGSLQDTATGKNLASVNPYLQQQLDAMGQQISDRVNGAFSSAGRYGSGAQTGVLGRELGNAYGNVLSTNWENERNRQLSAASTLQDVYGQGLNRASNLALNGQQITDQLYDPYAKQMMVGDYYDQRNQGGADAAAQKYLLNRDLKWNDLANLTQIVGASPTGSYTQSTGSQIAPTTRQSGLTTGIGLGTALIGAVAGNASNAAKASDIRVKTDIRRIGTAWNGLPLYLYRYKSGGPFEVGVMAQDVERVKPGAVNEAADGTKMVRYDLAFAEAHDGAA